MFASLATFQGVAVNAGIVSARARQLIEEAPVALTAQGSTLAVMLATPADLEDFALGFCISEGIAASAGELEAIETLAFDQGVELRLTLSRAAQARFEARRRNLAGPAGCGLCGIESLEQACLAPAPITAEARISPAAIARAVASLDPAQRLHAATRAAHGAGVWHIRSRKLALLREDVGRHNALDKLIGAATLQGFDPAETAVIVTSRVSVELVQKTARLGAPILIACSAPTTLAVRAAEQAGLTLIGVARGETFEAFTRRDRLELNA